MIEEKDNSFIEKLSGVLDILICLLLSIMSLYKGGFYKADTAFSNVIIGVFGFAVITVKLIRNIRNNGIIKRSSLVSIIDVLIIFMPICFLFPIVFKTYANIEGSINEFLTYMNFSIIYFITRSTKNRKYYINTIIIIGVLLAVLGIDEVATRQIEKIISNVSISYVTGHTGRLASTLQYANVTALILLIAMQLVIYKLVKTRTEQVDYFTSYKKSIYSFLIMFLTCTVILTNSRMAIILLIISNILIGIYLIKQKSKDIAIVTSILTLSSFFITNYIEKKITNLEYKSVNMIFPIIFLFFIIITFCKNNIVINNIFKRIIKNIKNKVGMLKIKKIISIICVVIIIVVTSSVLFIYAPFVIKTNNEDRNYQGRNIYSGYNIGNNNIEITLNKSQDAKYNIYVYEVYDDFSRSVLLNQKDFTIKHNDDKSLTLLSNINVTEKTKNLRMSITVKTGCITVKQLKINNKAIRLSYYLLPDSFIFKLNDTFNHDQNNILRQEYYSDAIKLIKISPVIGLGGEGFLARYQEVQTSNYISSEAHSSLLQICVETGLLGGCTFIAIIVVTVIILIKVMQGMQNKDLVFFLFIAFLSYVITSIFDITMSFQLLVLILAIIIGLIVSKAFDELKKTDINVYKIDNKSILAFIKIYMLTIFLMVIGYFVYYSYNVYKAEMIIVYDNIDSNNISAKLKKSYTDISLYEEKLKYDKYNINHAINLNKLYSEHIKIVSKLIITEKQKDVKETLQKDVIEYTIRQKQNIDNLLEYDFFNKYILEIAAKNYFKNFLVYSNIYKDNFSTTEVAYAFYLGYAIKLTERIEQIGPYNKVANEMVDEIYNTNYTSLSSKNSYIKSNVINSILQDIKHIIDKKGD